MNLLTLKKQKEATTRERVLIAQTIAEILADPDLGLELSERTKKRLKKARISKARGIPFSEIKRKYL